MRLLSIRLDGRFKGLKDQALNFSDSTGNFITFIGLNGSGKSQLLELVAEVFGYLERYLRDDFKCRNWFDNLEIELIYSNQLYDTEDASNTYTIKIDVSGQVNIIRDEYEVISDGDFRIEEVLPSQIIGYSSGLNENLQRPFMKSAIQYFDAMSVKRAWERRLESIKNFWDEKGERLTESNLELYDRQITEAYDYYHRRFPGVFKELPSDANVTDNPDIGPRATPLPRLKYLDHDSTALMLIGMGMMSDSDQQDIWKEKQRFNRVSSVVIRFDLRGFTHDTGALLDIAKIIKCVGGTDSNNFNPSSRVDRTPVEFYNQYELDYLAGEISVDFGNANIRGAVIESFFEPVVLFEKLYRLQLLASKHWPGEMKKNLRQDEFIGSIKKPQKWMSPIQVISLKLTDGKHDIEYDDLSDGEAQLIQILSMSSIYKDSRTLFLFDEPETHLNPSWRTYFHAYINDIINRAGDNQKVQLFVSTHSPFMVSSLKRENVYCFRRDQQDDRIFMNVAQSETYGASFDVLVKDYFEMRSLISQSVVQEIRRQLDFGDAHAKEWIEDNLGLSAERAYLIRRLSQ